jgi:calcineurin-like phosphoesterase family protein
VSRVFHTSDWHLGHKNILKYRPQFKTIKEHDDLIFENYLNTIIKRDTVYFHGDMLFSLDYFERFKELPGHKILIVGNHDTDFLKLEEIMPLFDRTVALTKKKQAWLSHAPIHPTELRGKFNIHGHMHDQTLDDPRYFSVCLEQTNYTPIDRQEINKYLKDLE